MLFPGTLEGIGDLEFGGKEELFSSGVACCELFPKGFLPPIRLNAALAAASLGESGLIWLFDEDGPGELLEDVDIELSRDDSRGSGSGLFSSVSACVLSGLPGSVG